ncbi:hypothetical protein ACIBCT_21240 [Streptosporangium sp. NPDC050855]|uniref:hypothetical protein n=1 Tax=Streptosporangium sp. NPDC050855 TaxID=3366194 RepID=UPI0037A64F62
MLVAEHYDAIEADLWMHCHRTDLRDLWRPGGGEAKLTWRLVANLIRHLPPESATKTAMRNKMSDAEIKQATKGGDPSQGQWSQLEMLTASLIDSVRWLVHITAAANGSKKSKAPDPVPRPGVKPKGKTARRQLTPEQQEAVWRRINGGSLSGSWRASEPVKAARLPPA